MASGGNRTDFRRGFGDRRDCWGSSTTGGRSPESVWLSRGDPCCFELKEALSPSSPPRLSFFGLLVAPVMEIRGA